MSTRGSKVVSWLGASAVIALMLFCASSAGAQTVSPCCAKVCNANGTSTACKPLLLGGLGSGGALGQGCVDVETAPPGSVCLGGTLGGGDPAGLISCICIFGGEDGSGQCNSGQDGSTLEPNDCTIRSVAGCGDNVVTAPDPDCAPSCEPGCCADANGTCTNLATSATCPAGKFVAGKLCGDPACTYVSGASLQRAPSTMLAMLFGMGAVGLLLPSRKR
jgi:hypothetical protein